jgi:uncharacterized protein (DUF1697 family)
MTVVISMLRAVNLAAHNRIKMDELRAVYESLKLKSPRTYVQSGNVVFGAPERELPRLPVLIQKAIRERFGFGPEVILRTAAEMRDVVTRNPFAGRSHIEPGKLLVTFLASDPGPEAGRKLQAIKVSPEELHLNGREMYIYYPNGMGRSKLPAVAIGKALGIPGTARNWNSVTKLLEMAEAFNSEK